MATINEPRRSMVEEGQRVRHPLQTIRGYIRSYVLLEGLGVAIVYLAVWFWVGLALDWGLFQLFAFDWIQELQSITLGSGADFWLRLALLGVLLAGLLAVVVSKMFMRLMREFSDPAVALLLERRFPRELGDRLITAVEMADPRVHEKYGISGPLIEQTIHDAVERVEKLPVADVFNWARLTRLFVLCGALTAGLYLAAGVGTCVLGAVDGSGTTPWQFMWRFRDVASIWAERNLLLMDSYWPRNAYIEVVRFQGARDNPSEMRVGRDEQRPDLQVRAVRWVVADRSVMGGWRALEWRDLDKFIDPDLLKSVDIPADWSGWPIDTDDLDPRVPNGILPASWQGKSSGDIRRDLANPRNQTRLQTAHAEKAVAALLDWRTWTVDKLELQLVKVSAALRPDHPDAVKALEKISEQLDELVLSPSMTRSLRKLDIPNQVTVEYRGDNVKNDLTYEVLRDNKYAIGLNELKESVRFTVRGDDYYTPTKSIKLVPPPSLANLTVDKEEPAYIYHRLQDDQTPLRGKKQIFKNHPISVTGEISVIPVPLGTSLVLTGELEKGRFIKDGVRILAPDKFSEPGALVPDAPVQVSADGTRFSLKIDRVTKSHEFYFDFNDQDNVKGRRRVIIRPLDDRAPEIFDLEIEAVLRKPRIKSNEGKFSHASLPEAYLITPNANIPIKGTIRDDYGLTNVEWVFNAEQIEVELFGDLPTFGAKPPPFLLKGNARYYRPGLALSGFQFLPGLGSLLLAKPGYWAGMERLLKFDLALPRFQERSVPLESFLQRQAQRSTEITPLVALDEKLRQPPPNRKLLNDLTFHDPEGFNVRLHLKELKSKDPLVEPQLHYLITLALQATDNNIETGPGISRGKMPFTFLMISETELLAQIGLEEEVLSERLDKTYDKLKGAKVSLQDQVSKLSQAEPTYQAIAIRVDEIRKAIMDASIVTREVFNDYTRIKKELEVNSIGNEKYLTVVIKICSPLEKLLDPQFGEFAGCETETQKLYEGLDADALALSKGNPPTDLLRKQRLDAAGKTRDQVDILMAKLNDVLVEMQKEVTYAKSLEAIIAIETAQRMQAQALLHRYREQVQKDIDDLLRPPTKDKK